MRTECFLLVVIAYGVGFIDCSSISSNPHATSIHENMNGVKSLWTLATSCDYNYLCSYTYNYECNCGGDGCGPCQGTAY
ncbi:hypothetical protein DPMN_046567 [Dreissena polymorpha]|uniref:Uncharacterized protein n=1 Tax=Dreissena polymorpha TaxID=45954 RepID=A0A9D4D720_DREPO|nr:hypothetical protein DPMN_046567 [Dreissena polymorpha]